MNRKRTDWIIGNMSNTMEQQKKGAEQGQVIVATCIRVRINVPDIRVVVHVAKIWTLQDCAPEG